MSRSLKMLVSPRTLITSINHVKIIKLPILSLLESDICTKWCLTLHYHSLKNPAAIPSVDYSDNSSVAQSNWLITKLSREGKIREARKFFDEMPDRDVVTWTTLLSGYIRCGLLEEARKLFDSVNAKKNVVTWTAMVRGYARSNRIVEAERLFEDMPVKNVISWNTMIDGYVQNGKVDKALEVFEKMPEKNIVSWNTIITALAQCGRIDEARRLFDGMPKRDIISWTAMVTGLAKSGRIDEARRVFNSMPQRNVVSWNAMITGYAQNMRLDEALELFEKMPKRNLASWNTTITGSIQNSELKLAEKLFYMMPKRTVVSWTTMITGYIQDGQSEEALKMFTKMLSEEKVKPNDGTFVTILSACSDLAGLREGQQVHQMICKTVYQNCEFIVSALINMYSKCGELSTARRMFHDGLEKVRDVVSWNCMIAAYAHHGCGGEAINLFEEMLALGFKPNDVTYVALLSACGHSGLVEEGLNYFDKLERDKSIQVREDHYVCLVDLCGRAGRLDEALDFIKQLGSKPPASTWTALLAGCNFHGNLAIGKLAAKELLGIEPENINAHLLLSSIYASRGRQREATEVRMKMKDKGMKKSPGCSWIEVGSKVHVFVAGHRFNHHNAVYPMLCYLHEKMKKAENISNKDYTADDVCLVV